MDQYSRSSSLLPHIGLPIRASDKCSSGESECLPSFQEYMDATHEIWMQQQYQHMYDPPDRHNNNDETTLVPINVIVTTESKQIRREIQQFTNAAADDTNHSRYHPIHYQLQTNPYDVTQDTGYFEDYHYQQYMDNYTQYTANDIMLSTLSSLQLQLYATHLTVGNCCSNFHLIIKDLFNIGCGVPRPKNSITATKNNKVRRYHHQFQCLQNHPNNKYRICCSWDKSIECQNKRRSPE
jgi:hypothetical protein